MMDYMHLKVLLKLENWHYLVDFSLASTEEELFGSTLAEPQQPSLKISRKRLGHAVCAVNLYCVVRQNLASNLVSVANSELLDHRSGNTLDCAVADDDLAIATIDRLNSAQYSNILINVFAQKGNVDSWSHNRRYFGCHYDASPLQGKDQLPRI